jgi:hypothetical protein
MYEVQRLPSEIVTMRAVFKHDSFAQRNLTGFILVKIFVEKIPNLRFGLVSSLVAAQKRSKKQTCTLSSHGDLDY